MPLWITRKLSGIKSMRGFRDKIKGTKTKLLRRDSKDSTEEAISVRPAKAVKGTAGSWGRKSKRQSIGKEASRSDHSLATNSDRNTDEPSTPTVGSSGYGDIVIEGGTVGKRSGESRRADQDDIQPQLVSSSPLAKPPLPLDSHLGPPSSNEPSPTAPITDASVETNPIDAHRDIPLVLAQKDSSHSKTGILGSDPQPSQLPLAENEHPPQPQTNNVPSSSAPLEERVTTEFSTPLSNASHVSQSGKSTGSDSTVTASNSNPTGQPVEPQHTDLTHIPAPLRPYRLSQFPTDWSGIRTDTDVSTLSQLRQSSSKTSLSVHSERGSFEIPDNEEKDSVVTAIPHDQGAFGQINASCQPLESQSAPPIATEIAQVLPPVAETISVIPNEAPTRNDSIKYNRPTLITPSNSRRKTAPTFPRRQSLIHASDTGLLHSLLEQESASPTYSGAGHSNVQLVPVPMPQNEHHMRNRRVWVKRPGGSPTQVIVSEDDYVDTVRDLCLRKYANALGRQFDSPDLMIRIFPSAKPNSARARQISNLQLHVDRVLLPDENLCQVLDDYYPSGQTSEDALVVEVPQQQRTRTPRPSPGPHAMTYAYGTVPSVHDLQLPGEDYFTPVGGVPSIPHSQTATVRSTHNIPANPSSLSNYIANSPPPSSPGHRTIKRPGPVRMTTASPVGSASSSVQGNAGGVMLIPRGGAERARTNGEVPPSPAVQPQMVALPSSPGLNKQAVEKPESPLPIAHVTSPIPAGKPNNKLKDIIPISLGPLDGQVPAINVLIVEDNIINLKLLEAFMKRLKVRWQTAMNGRDAVTKWRTGGFQLVLMDIQLPVMNGLDATKEIRRLERLNGIGSFSSNPSCPEETLSGTDKLDKSLVFKGSVIIVALTASSLQSDRHEALAVGCNDFLTKPVNFTFLERKVMEWGCMQALIDFEGWRKWKDLASKPNPAGGKTTKGGRAGRNAVKAKDKPQTDIPPPSVQS